MTTIRYTIPDTMTQEEIEEMKKEHNATQDGNDLIIPPSPQDEIIRLNYVLADLRQKDLDPRVAFKRYCRIMQDLSKFHYQAGNFNTVGWIIQCFEEDKEFIEKQARKSKKLVKKYNKEHNG